MAGRSLGWVGWRDVVGWLVGRGGGGRRSSLDRHGKGEGQLNSRKSQNVCVCVWGGGE